MTTREEIISFNRETRPYYKKHNMNLRWLHRFADLDYCNKKACSDFFNHIYQTLKYYRNKTARAFLPYDAECDGTEAEEDLDKEQLEYKREYEAAYKKEKGIENTLAFVMYAYLHRYYKIPHVQACIIQQSVMSHDEGDDIFLMMQYRIEDIFALYTAGRDWAEDECREMENANATVLKYFGKLREAVSDDNKALPMERLFPYLINCEIISDIS